MDRRIWKNFKQDTRVSLLMRCAEEWRQIRLSNQSSPKLQWCSARVQNAYMPPGPGARCPVIKKKKYSGNPNYLGLIFARIPEFGLFGKFLKIHLTYQMQ
ncbi:hypothetical protein AVEN_25642-1 [Araneus ventricosus]|uniref:Uncharacterized protein n=1 Tax=Araneus ventricosus TaxID=182803 RepID=A0A4Y2BN24_ARAVE|nr:hypothetical protein AVEN_25642-1 [Araneus ventricosus]